MTRTVPRNWRRSTSRKSHRTSSSIWSSAKPRTGRSQQDNSGRWRFLIVVVIRGFPATFLVAIVALWIASFSTQRALIRHDHLEGSDEWRERVSEVVCCQNGVIYFC